MNRVKGKVALVTGAARGLGYDIAKLLAEEGATVFVSDINEEQGKASAAEMGGSFCAHDATSENAWQEVMVTIQRSHGRLDILVNNAGVANLPGPKDPERSLLETWRKIIAVNGESVFLGCKYAIPLMRKSGGGSIVNLSSIAALVPTPFISAYGFSKAGVLQFTRSVALHCAQTKSGIRCNSVHPGQIETEMLKGLFEEIAAEAGVNVNEARALFLAKIPQGEFQSGRDIAYAVLFLASDESRFVTGTQMVVDGGMSLVS